MATEEGSAGVFDPFRQFFALERDVLVLSVAMFAFSLGFQMTSRYVPEYMAVLGATPFVIGLYGTFGNVISAVYPYPGGAFSDRIGSRYALTLFGLLSTLGFLFWLIAPLIGTVELGGLAIEPWIWIFVGLILAQAWKSFGLGATFAIVKQSVSESRLARGFASTETFRRTAFLIGPLLAAGLLYFGGGDVLPGFLYVLGVATAFGVAATVVQHFRYDASEDTIGKEFEGVQQIARDLGALPAELRPLLVGDTLVRFANGMVYVFFVIVITRFLEVDVTLFGYYLSPEVFFGVLLGLEMVVALLVMAPAAKIAEHVGLKPVVALGFAVYAVFPVLLIFAPPNAFIVGLLFAFSGLRFAGLPSHKALIVGPAERDAGGRVTGAYYLLRNAIVIPSAALGGYLWDFVSPELAFALAATIGLVGTGYFLAFGKEFEAYVS
ncbi:MFS transporter [Halomarina halobia]|uniref:MFS transporter n=1 Tax=Halomarina halobia TaxID=3033386 RepID=A0ABD6A6L6_9EURY|nr:MFS transporter [Halomarina sp. PSR21]